VPRWCGASSEFIAKAKRQPGIAETEQLFVGFGDDFRRVYARYAGPKEFSPDWGLRPMATKKPWPRFALVMVTGCAQLLSSAEPQRKSPTVVETREVRGRARSPPTGSSRARTPLPIQISIVPFFEF
jgi:hypothetical protein